MIAKSLCNMYFFSRLSICVLSQPTLIGPALSSISSKQRLWGCPCTKTDPLTAEVVADMRWAAVTKSVWFVPVCESYGIHRSHTAYDTNTSNELWTRRTRNDHY